MVTRLLIGDNNLSRFWPAYQFSRPSLKTSTLITSTDLDTLDHGLTQTEDRELVIVSVLTSLLLDEVNQSEVSCSAANVFEQVLTRLTGLCPRTPSCQVRFCFFVSFFVPFCWLRIFSVFFMLIYARYVLVF